MVILTIIIGLANSIGLWIIGAAVWDCHYDFVLSFAAILKVVCEEFEELKPIALIIAEKIRKRMMAMNYFLSRWWEKTKKILYK
jgi:hypothetical protein